ncbi:chaperone protein EcpD [Luteibacter rhizovicinus]|uniref:Chaperone protein EcpD n=1 Tax=Luteibacter rhizovicinus TaxID=242606 RepID=A0A4R3YMK5_9GAMM|nr:fimbria/pilus periplasmic chaperone [Luteibacter rhizovicinus]TCV93867.1 chaperone protein EcpD [Luteibacter rhizovicinus]
MPGYRKLFVLVGIAAFFAFSSLPTWAGVIIGGTRVVFPAKAREVTVRLQNKATDPALVQAWVDNGDERSSPDTADAPFTLSPPIFRMEPGKGHSLRLIHTGEPLPTDKETLFWLNVLEVPPKPKDAAGQNILQFAFRIRIKLFYRPENLAYASVEAPQKLTWTLIREGQEVQLEVTNPTPYHVTFSDVALVSGSQRFAKREAGGGMVSPGEKTRFPIVGVDASAKELTVEFKTINDYGAMVSANAHLTH